MAARLQNYTAETVPPPGTGAITCPGTAVAGGKTFANSFANGDTVFYQLNSSSSSQFEVGIGTFNLTAGTLARTTVLWNSSGTTSPINITVACILVCQIPAQRQAVLDDNLLLQVAQQPSLQQDQVRISTTVSKGNIGQWTTIAFDTNVLNGIGTVGSTPVSSFTMPTTGFYRLTYRGGHSTNNNNITPLGGNGSSNDIKVGFFIDGAIVASGMAPNTVKQIGTQAGNNVSQPGNWDVAFGFEWFGLINAGSVVTAKQWCTPRGTGGTGTFGLIAAINEFSQVPTLAAPVSNVICFPTLTITRYSE